MWARIKQRLEIYTIDNLWTTGTLSHEQQLQVKPMLCIELEESLINNNNLGPK